MPEYITKYDFMRILQKSELWKNLIPEIPALRWEYTPNFDVPFDSRWSYMEYDEELNPMWHLENANKMLSIGYITNVRFNTMKLRCLSAYWSNWLRAKEWREWYTSYCYDRDKEDARKRFASIFVQEYIEKQKEELAAGCSKLVFDDGKQISEDLQNRILEYM